MSLVLVFLQVACLVHVLSILLVGQTTLAHLKDKRCLPGHSNSNNNNNNDHYYKTKNLSKNNYKNHSRNPKSRDRLKCGVGFELAAPTNAGAPTGCRQVAPGQFPFHAYVNSSESSLVCGAAVVSERYLITAGHLVANRDLSSLQVVVGDHDRDIADGEQVFEIDEILTPDNYEFSLADFPALIKLKQKMVFKITPNGLGSVNRICPPPSGGNFTVGLDEVLLAGWGLENEGAAQYISTRNIVADHETAYRVDVSAAGGPDGVGKCHHADPGGPLFRLTAHGQAQLLGSSYYWSLSGRPPVHLFAKTSHHLAWIKDTISKEYLRQ